MSCDMEYNGKEIRFVFCLFFCKINTVLVTGIGNKGISVIRKFVLFFSLLFSPSFSKSKILFYYS